MSLDVSQNLLSDASIKSFASLLMKNFQGLSSVNLSSIKKMNSKDTGYIDLAKALRENKSLVSLDLRENEIHDSSLQKIFEALENNFVLSEVKIDIKRKKVPISFSSYPLMSMYEFTTSLEDIYL